MTITSLDLDDSALQAVMRLSGTRTKKDAVNEALREYASRHERIAALERFAEVARDWDYDAWAEQHRAEKSAEG